MPDITLRIEQANNTFRLDGIEAEYTRSLTEQARGEVQVYREDWNSIVGSIDERNDTFFIEVDGTDEFGGRFDDAETNGATVSVRLNSPEIDAAQAEPTEDNVTYTARDADHIATQAINSVSTLSTGTINTSATGLDYSVSHGSQSKILYDLREMADIEFRYNADFTVDVLDRLGSGRALTLGPAEGNVGTGFNKTVDQRENVTHVRVLGGESGPNQITAEAVSSAYTGGRKVWRRYPKKEIIDPGRAQDVADALITEYENDPRAVEVECRVYNEDLSLGDTVTVDYPEENINRDLRLVSLTREITRRGFVLLATLSNRALTTENTGSTKRNDDIQTHNRGHGGFVDRDQVTSGWNPAGDGTPQTLEVVNWPDDIVEEKTVELVVQGRAWRSPVDPLSHDHSVTISDTATNNTDFDETLGGDFSSKTVELPIGGGHQNVSNLGVNTDSSILFLLLSVRNKEGATATINAYTEERSSGDQVPGALGYAIDIPPDSIGSYVFVWSRNANNETYDYYLEATSASTDTDGDGDVEVEYRQHFQAAGLHTHDVSDTATTKTTTGLDPKVITSFNGNTYYPTSVDIEVNGSVITTVAGNNTQDWQETVDLSGELTPGQNTITATPTGQRGSLNLTLASELFRRGEVS